MPKRISPTLSAHQNTTNELKPLHLCSSTLLPAVPQSRTRQRSQTHLPDPILISQLPSSLSLLSGPGLSPPPPTRFRTLPKRVPSHLLAGHTRSQSAPTLHLEKTRKPSGPTSGIRKASSTPPLPTILVTTSPDLPRRNPSTPQSPSHLRVTRHHGAKQLRDRHHRDRALRPAGAGRVRHLRDPEPRQHLRQEGARAGRGPGGGLMTETPATDDPVRTRQPPPDPTAAGEGECHTFVAFSPPPPPIPPRRQPQTVFPPTPPATPPLSPPPLKHSRSKSYALGTAALGGVLSCPRPPTPPAFGGDGPESKRTLSGRMRWEDERDSWF